MDTTINDLYLKYTEGVEENLEGDRYFQYLFEMVQAGEHTLQQKNRTFHKVVDETWLTMLEEGLEPLFRIVEKPRRFIATSEEVVPVELAKKITADSVRHLSMHTQYIAGDENGDIYPTKILNATTKESYDLYENRFIYHLIQRLFTFVDKRTDVIFWSAGDETCNTMSMESKVDDAYEEISYKVEMTIRNCQTYGETDSDNMEVFKRIDRLRRMARTLRESAFCRIMAGCAMVRSPIQRTNLMMKDPDYRACYKLWKFMEDYDSVGYTIEERDAALEFDEEYLLQMYTNLITSYTVFKSLLESDPRSMWEIEEKKREPVKPKFIKEIKEEEVQDRDLPDVEIRRVFVEEVTRAQVEAEEKLAQETARCEELSDQVSSLNRKNASLELQLQEADELQAQLEGQLDEAQLRMEEQLNELIRQLEEERSAREAAEESGRQAEKTARERAKEAADWKRRYMARGSRRQGARRTRG